jgi:hypothetical protein
MHFYFVNLQDVAVLIVLWPCKRYSISNSKDIYKNTMLCFFPLLKNQLLHFAIDPLKMKDIRSLYL